VKKGGKITAVRLDKRMGGRSVMLSQILSGLITTTIILGFCLLFYRLRHKKFSGFLNYIGAYSTNLRSVLTATLLAISVLLCSLVGFSYLGLQNLVLNPNTPAWSLRLNGFSFREMGNIFVYAWVGTALWEEIFFRGFLAKRLIARMGFFSGNLCQAVIFGFLHVLMYHALKIYMLPTAYILLFSIPTLLAYGMVYINEREAAGSILPGYVTHAVLNTLTPIAVAMFF